MKETMDSNLKKALRLAINKAPTKAAQRDLIRLRQRLARGPLSPTEALVSWFDAKMDTKMQPKKDPR